MRRITLCLVAAVLVTQAPSASFAQNTGPMTSPAATPLAKPSRIKLTVEHLKEMRAKWALNRPKMKACRAEVRSKGLTGDDRWFYMEDCMGKT
jgi:psiF repeat